MESTGDTDIDLAKVQDFIKGQVETYAEEAFRNQARQSTSQASNTPTAEEAAQAQLRNVLAPFIEPGLNEARFVAADARDYTDFYSDPTRQEDKAEVEKMFAQLKANGKAIPRQDIYDYLNGKKARENPEEFTQKMTAKQRKQIETASTGMDPGLSAFDRARNDPVWSNVNTMPLDELGKALEGMAF